MRGCTSKPVIRAIGVGLMSCLVKLCVVVTMIRLGLPRCVRKATTAKQPIFGPESSLINNIAGACKVSSGAAHSLCAPGSCTQRKGDVGHVKAGLYRYDGNVYRRGPVT